MSPGIRLEEHQKRTETCPFDLTVVSRALKKKKEKKEEKEKREEKISKINIIVAAMSSDTNAEK